MGYFSSIRTLATVVGSNSLGAPLSANRATGFNKSTLYTPYIVHVDGRCWSVGCVQSNSSLVKVLDARRIILPFLYPG
jgi:hypothetical protein